MQVQSLIESNRLSVFELHFLVNLEKIKPNRIIKILFSEVLKGIVDCAKSLRIFNQQQKILIIKAAKDCHIKVPKDLLKASLTH